MSESPTEKDKMRRWLDAWEIAGRELDEAKTCELRALTEQDAARRFDALAWPRESLWFSPERSGSEGFIEQQRFFQRARQH